MNGRIFIPSFFCLLALPASAQTWISLGVGETGAEYFIDENSVLDYGAEKEFWTKTDASSDQTLAFKESKDFVRLDCDSRRVAVTYTIEYFRSGKLEETGPIFFPVMTPIPPGSIADAWRVHVCDEPSSD